MKVKNENGIKWISCDNLGELVEEFKKFRAAQIAIGQKRKYNDYFFLQMLRHRITEVEGGIIPNEEIDSVEVYQRDGVDLALNIAPLNLKEKDWIPHSKKVEKILQEIWETGEVKNYQGLDLNWPVVSQSEKNQFPNNSDKNRIKELEKEKTIWMIISITTVSIFALILLLCWLKRKKN